MQSVAAEGYLADESRLQGLAAKAYLAQSEADIVAVLAEARAGGIEVTIQGGLTGITGAAVPLAGHVLNLRNMRKVLGLRREGHTFILRAQPGCTLESIRRMLLAPGEMDVASWSQEAREAWRMLCRAPEQMFAPDLTETGATLGGVVSTNGSGARSYRYGAARAHIAGLRVILMDGEILALQRGKCFAQGRAFQLQSLSGRGYAGNLPAYRMPAVKHAAGYFAHPDMDLLDLFIGSEGTLGVVSEVEITLLPRPEHVVGLTMFLSSEDAALTLVENLRGSDHDIQALEYFSAQALDLLRQPSRGARAGDLSIPPLRPDWHTALYVEVADPTGMALEEIVALLGKVGGDPDATWLAEGYHEIETLKGIRHAIPERINAWIAAQRQHWPDVTKLGTDLAVPDAHLRDVMQMYHADLQAAGLRYVIFGHIGNNHVHVNILPQNRDEWLRGKKLYATWADRVVQWGGTISAEHGVGKLKTEMLQQLFGAGGIAGMQSVKRVFDADFLLNRDTLFPAPTERPAAI